MSHATPQDVIARLPWDSSEIDATTFLSTTDIQAYLDEASNLLAPVVSVAAGLSADSLDATTVAQLRSAECDYAVYMSMGKMQMGSGSLAKDAFDRWEKTFKRYSDNTSLLNQQAEGRTMSNGAGNSSRFAGRNYRGH